jgi:hypothetical protein
LEAALRDAAARADFLEAHRLQQQLKAMLEVDGPATLLAETASPTACPRTDGPTAHPADSVQEQAKAAHLDRLVRLTTAQAAARARADSTQIIAARERESRGRAEEHASSMAEIMRRARERRRGHLARHLDDRSRKFASLMKRNVVDAGAATSAMATTPAGPVVVRSSAEDEIEATSIALSNTFGRVWEDERPKRLAGGTSQHPISVLEGLSVRRATSFDAIMRRHRDRVKSRLSKTNPSKAQNTADIDGPH